VLFNANEALGASVNFKYLTKSERTFLFKRMGVLNNPKLYGATGYENIGPKLGMFLPINKKKDPVSGNMVEVHWYQVPWLGQIQPQDGSLASWWCWRRTESYRI
jgi:hypothetical protein